MKLLKVKQIYYISPTQFLTWSSCQHKTYLTRLAGHPYLEPEPGSAAMIGTVFDAMVKCQLAKELGISKPSINFETMTKGIDSESLALGCRIGKTYIGDSEYRWLRGSIQDIEVEVYRICDGVPLFGKLDVLLKGGVPFDWKTRGFNSTYSTSPTAGHLTHKDKNVPFNLIKEPWAVQMAFYNWILDNKEPLKFLIHEVIPKGTYVIDGWLEQGWLASIWERVKAMWEAINADPLQVEIETPYPRESLCHAYGTVCEGAKYCTAYQQLIGSSKTKDSR